MRSSAGAKVGRARGYIILSLLACEQPALPRWLAVWLAIRIVSVVLHHLSIAADNHIHVALPVGEQKMRFAMAVEIASGKIDTLKGVGS